MADPETLIEQGRRLHQAGRLGEAAPFYEQARKLAPHHPDPPHLLGLLRHAEGDHGAARVLLGEALALAPGDPTLLGNLGRVTMAAGDWPVAAEAFEALTRSQADNAEAWNGLGSACRHLGAQADAEKAFKTALSLRPDYGGAWFNLGNLHLSTGNAEAALQAFEAAEKAGLTGPDLLANKATALSQGGHLDKAEAGLRAALALAPNHAGALNNLGTLMMNKGDMEAAEAPLRQALDGAGDAPEAPYNLGRCLAEQGRVEEAEPLFAKAALARTFTFRAALADALLLPVLYESDDHLAFWQARYRNRVAALGERLDTASPAGIADAASALAEIPNFRSAYGGLDVTDTQRVFGTLASRIAAARFPALAEPPPPRNPRPSPRIGFASSFLYTHTVLKLFAGWMVEPEVGDFQLFAFHLGRQKDRATEALAQSLDLQGPFAGPDAAAKAIRAADLDLLIFLDIGMDPLAQVLAALPLARRQAVAMGHPVTTGLPSIQTFLSSVDMEPAGADAHYCEALERLPGLGFFYPRPPVPDLGLDRGPGPAQGRPLALCAQSLFKILPRHDRLFAQLAKAVPLCRFAFIAHPRDAVTRAFTKRIKDAFKAQGQDAEARVTLHPRQDQAGFFRLLNQADILLDTPDWSGCNSTLEALACSHPALPVTLEGAFLRGRHTAALLRRLALDDLIGTDDDGYLAAAMRLATEPTFRSGKQAVLAANRDALFGDRRPIGGFADWVRRDMGA